MMENLFQNQSMPFYRFGDILFLDRIENQYLVDFVIRAFERTGKKIGENYAESLVKLMECHPNYVQQLADILWNRTETSVHGELFNDSVEIFLKQNQPFFHEILEDLTNTQFNFIKAYVSGEKHFSSADVLQNYKLGSSANIKRIKEALIKKNIISITSHGIVFEEPAVRILFERYFVKT
jgi:hypothetical protein